MSESSSTPQRLLGLRSGHPVLLRGGASDKLYLNFLSWLAFHDLFRFPMMQQRSIHNVFQARHVIDLDRHRQHRLSLGVLGRILPDDPIGIEREVRCLWEKFQV